MGDIADLEDQLSIARQRLTRDGEIAHEAIQTPNYHIPEQYKREIRSPAEWIGGSSNALEAIREWTRPIRTEIESHGWEAAWSGIDETLKNAYQHGNAEDPTKDILLAWRSNRYRLDVVVEDEGVAPLEEHMIPHILNLREKGTAAPGFYDLKGTEPPKNHAGVGMKTQHYTFDEVEYHLGATLGGIAVRMEKKS
jgi:anti-sigma regulatory factor (Ser/Thr protein kinase)